MRKNFQIRLLCKGLKAVLAMSLLFGSCAFALQDLDRKYSLESIGVLRSWDNLDGLFSDYVGTAYRDFFSSQTRFILVDLSKSDSLLFRSKLPYQRVIDDQDLLAQVAKSMRTQTVLRTKIYKEGPSYRFVMDWLHAPLMEAIASEAFVVDEPKDTRLFSFEDVKAALTQGLERLIRKVPFRAQVSGRDDEAVTVLLGDKQSVKKGDTLIVATTDEVKLHPILKAIVDWRFSETGKLVVESVDDGIAFCKIIEEEPGKKISKYQKIVQILKGSPKKDGKAALADADSSQVHLTRMDGTEEAIDPRIVDADPNLGVGVGPGGGGENGGSSRANALGAYGLDEKPRLGFGSGGFWIGNFSRDYSDGKVSRTGSGFLVGAKIDGQLWLTPEFFGELGFGYGYAGYTQKNPITGTPTTATSQNASLLHFRMAGGYTIYMDRRYSGPKGWLKLGYRQNRYELPASQTELMGTTSFGSLYGGLGGDLPFRGDFGINFEFDLGLLKGASESGLISSGSSTGTTDVGFLIGGYYKIRPRLLLRAGLDVLVNSAEFSSTTSYTNKVVSFGPSLAYYF